MANSSLNRDMSDLVVWKSDYEIGIPPIDQQHEKIVRLMYKMNHTLTEGTRKPSFVMNVLDELERYIEQHFAIEHKLMKATGYPELDQHGLEHDRFKASVLELREKFKTSIIDMKNVMYFIADWFVDHIQKSDREFAEWLAESRKSQSA